MSVASTWVKGSVSKYLTAMTILPQLSLRQSQSLTITPQMQQAIKLLQLSNIDLTVYVEQELEQNPLLERAENKSGAPDAGDDSGNQDSPVADCGDLTTQDHLPSRDEVPLDAEVDNAWANDGQEEGPRISASGLSEPAIGGGRPLEYGETNLEQTAPKHASLRDHLSEQIMIDMVDPIDRIIGHHLIEMLDEAGYISGDLRAAVEKLGCTKDRLLETLSKLQLFDPPGIFARDLAECLGQQLEDNNRLDPAMKMLLKHLDLLARHDLAALKKLCHVDDEDLADMVVEILALNPKPALAFDNTFTRSVIPDVLMHARSESGWHIELNSDTLPRVLINERYYSEIYSQTRGNRDRAYLSERLQAANWLIRALDQRAQTILKVSCEIVRQQETFFSKGVFFLKPLVLRDIANAVEMHESTVSRVTANKYIATPRGTLKLKYFFSTSLSGESGSAPHSTKAVRFRIKSLIEEEQVDGVLSDDRIVSILKSEGIHIARRTVAKYREAMKIPSSMHRRRKNPASYR